jgi:hypothetical protein
MENGAEKKIMLTNMMNQDMVEKKWDCIFTEKGGKKTFLCWRDNWPLFHFTLRQKWFIIYYLLLHYISTLCHNLFLNYSPKCIFFF